MEDNQPVPAQLNRPELPPPAEDNRRSRRAMFISAGIILVVLVLLVLGLIFLLRTDLATTSRIRDIFIIFMALESLVIGVALIVLIVQLATLINLLQNEIKPIIHSTNETVNTLRGTAAFLSENLTEPVIKLNEYLAAIRRLLELMRIIRR
jgi:heme/copper-type cytochrome/quinol oxidase subunit 2